eukprot:GEMP01004791.1.p1 GENE.GEMP01004791.1~~GEMP01004791.1.p1  ORF type:complete len:1021 (+),score=263.05 GEMP01004791.1:114-3176(+)
MTSIFLPAFIFLVAVCDAAPFLSTLKVRNERTHRIEVRRPINDNRRYVHTQLSNGVKVVAVQDDKAQHASFSMLVQAGSYEDPKDFPGLAHFCEHMLFLGSEKYTSPTAFSNHQSQFGGNHNAFTENENTVYFNTITPAGFEKGLDIFAQFFIAPSFHWEMADKEINAVNSEHLKNMPDSTRRTWEVLRSLASDKSPVSKFFTGNAKTLRDIPAERGLNVSEALQKFHKQYYVADRMHLVLIANKTCEELLDMAHTYFDVIKEAHSGPRPAYYSTPAFPPANLGQRVFARSTGTPQLWAMIPLPDELHAKYRENVGLFLGYLWSHYGPRSLKSALTKKNLISNLDFTLMPTVAGSQFWAVFDLTDKGAENHKEVLATTFAYIDHMRHSDITAITVSLQRFAQHSFDWAERASSEMSFASGLAQAMSKYAPVDILTGGSLIDNVDADFTTHVLSSIHARNMNYALMTPAFDLAHTNAREEWYDVDYFLEPIPDTLLQEWTILSPDIAATVAAAPPLAFVPDTVTKADLVTETARDDPEELRRGVWWHGASKAARVPKIEIRMKLAFTVDGDKRAHSVLTAALRVMHEQLVADALEEPSDALQSCGMRYEFSGSNDGLTIAFSGFDQHIERLITMVMPVVRSTPVNKERFTAIKARVLMQLSDVSTAMAFQHGMEALAVLTESNHFSREEIIQIWDKVTEDAFKEYLENVVATCTLTTFFLGNVDHHRAIVLANAAAKTGFSLGGLSSLQTRVLDPRETLEMRMENPLRRDTNHAVINVYQFPRLPTIEDRVHLMLLGALAERPVFDFLRTERQLGYVVQGSVSPHVSIVELRVLVQGSKAPPDEVDALIEESLLQIGQAIRDLTPTQLAQRKKALQVQLDAPDANMDEETSRLWTQIYSTFFCFKKKQLALEYLRSMDDRPDALMETWHTLTGASQKKISVKVFANNVPIMPRENGPIQHGVVLKYANVLLGAPRGASGASYGGYYENKAICDNPQAKGDIVRSSFKKLRSWHTRKHKSLA